MSIKDWYEPDRTWPAIGIDSIANYINHYVTEGHFHSSVHEDVVKAYETAEHMMALAWYHYPMFDEAWKKVLSIFELSVKLRCQQLNIATVTINSNGKRKPIILANLIDKLSAKEPEKDIRQRLNWARRARNYHAHPEQHSYMGGMAVGAIVPLLNLINLIFQNYKEVLEAKRRLAHLKHAFAQYQQGLFVLERDGNRFLVTSAAPLQAHLLNGRLLTFWHITPVLVNVYEEMSRHRYSPPIVVALTEIRENGICLEAKEAKSEAFIRLYPTVNPVHYSALAQHQQEWSQVSEHDQHLYLFVNRGDVNKQLEKLQYELCWGSD